MFVGVIRTWDIVLHPREIIRMRGVKGYFKVLWRALRKKPYSFIGMTQQSDWVFDKRVQEDIKTDPKLRARLPQSHRASRPTSHQTSHQTSKTSSRRQAVGSR